MNEAPVEHSKPERKVLRVFFLAAAIAWYASITVVSHIPGQSLSNLHIWDKAAHFGEYMILGILAGAWMMMALAARRPWSLFLWGTALLAVLGILDELHQSTVPGRDVSALDVLADTLGGMFGLMCAAVLVRRGGKKASQ